jgi:hypothetical protein
MATTAANVRVGVSGECHLAPAGTALPTDSSTALAAGFDALGYNTDAGVTETINDTRTDIQAWQNGDVVRRVRTSHVVEYAFTLLETSAETLEAYYGDFTNGVVKLRGDTETRGVWAIEVVDGADVVRIVIPDGEVTQRGGVQYVNGDAVAYPVTITCYPDANGDKAIKYYGALTT